MEIIKVNIGKVEEEKQFTITRSFDKAITAVSCGCGCSIPDFKKLDKSITVRYTPKQVTSQLKRSGKHSFETAKSCTVTFDDKTKLSFQWTATVFTKRDRYGKLLPEYE